MPNSFATSWSVAWQVPLSMGFSRQEYWSGLPSILQGIFLLQGNFPIQRSNLHLLHLLHWQEEYLSLSHQGCPFLLYFLILLICWLNFPHTHMLSTFSCRSSNIFILVIWMSQSHNPKPGPPLSLIFLIDLFLDNNFNFLPYIFECLVILSIRNCMQIIKTEVNIIYAWKWWYFFCYTVSVGMN